MTDTVWPTEIRLSRDKRTLTVTFDDGAAFAIPAELLRVRSPSAEVQGHAPDQRVTVPGKREVAILEVAPVGSYAVRLRFDDMHDTGIYTWPFLRDIGARQGEVMAEYEAELAAKGMSRDRARRG